MARINTTQLRTWQNGDIIPAQDYNQERNLIIEANNDTNDKANLATQNAETALNYAERLQATGLPVEKGSVVKSLALTLSEGQNTITIPEPGFLPNTNRVQAFRNGVLQDVTEVSGTQLLLSRPAVQGDRFKVVWYVEVPDIIDIQRIEDAIRSSYADWLNPIQNEVDLPTATDDVKLIAVKDSRRVYRSQNGMWVYVFDIPQYIGDGLPGRKAIRKTLNVGEDTITLEKAFVPDQFRVDLYISGVRQRIGIDYVEADYRTIKLTTPAKHRMDCEIVYYTTDIATIEDLSDQVSYAESILSQMEGVPEQLDELVTNTNKVLTDVEATFSQLEDKGQQLDTLIQDAEAQIAMEWGNPVETYDQLPQAPAVGTTVAVKQDKKAYRYESGGWRAIMDLTFVGNVVTPSATVPMNQTTNDIWMEILDSTPSGYVDTIAIQNATIQDDQPQDRDVLWFDT